MDASMARAHLVAKQRDLARQLVRPPHGENKMTSTLTPRRHPATYVRSSAAYPVLAKIAEPPRRQKPVALIIDRDADFRYILTQMLVPLGYDVVETDNVGEARWLAARKIPALIVTDLRTGLHDTNIIPGELRRVPTLEWTPMIVCSAWPYPEDRTIAQSVGADLFMTVPVDFRAIRELAAQLISGPA